MDVQKELIAEYDRETANTRKLLEAIPENADFAWKPHEKSMAFGRLAAHVSDTNGDWAMHTLSRERLDWTPDMNPTDPTNKKDLLARFDKQVSEVKPALAGSNGLAGSLLTLVSTLPGFYFAGLAAVATFGNATMDREMPAPAPEVEMLIQGQRVSAPPSPLGSTHASDREAIALAQFDLSVFTSRATDLTAGQIAVVKLAEQLGWPSPLSSRTPRCSTTRRTRSSCCSPTFRTTLTCSSRPTSSAG